MTIPMKSQCYMIMNKMLDFISERVFVTTPYKKDNSWHFCDFIAEIPLGSKTSRNAFKLFDPNFKVAIINYFDAKRRGYFNKKKDVREDLGIY